MKRAFPIFVCLVLVVVPLFARTVTVWPLGCDEKGRPDGRCAVSSANDLIVGDVTHVGKLGDGRTALMATGGEEASDFAYSDVVGRYVTPTNDFTLEGWYNFTRLPNKGETWMVASAFGGDNRWFLTLRRDSIHKGLTWQIFAETPNTGNSLLTTVTDPDTLTNGWHRFALTFNHRTAAGEAEWRFYLDGQPAGHRAVKAFQGTFNGGTRFALGGRGRAGNVIAGSLSCCRISDRVLSPAEFLQPDMVHVGTPCWKALPVRTAVPDTPDGGRTLYNGIVLPQEWPPRIDPKDPNPIPAPYLQAANIPKVIPIDVGRQLFVDDFLIESTNGVVRAFGKPVKYEGNPVMWRQTKAEMSAQAPGCAMSGGGVWWDPTRRKFRMWYMSGFAGRISYAESPDGVHWDRPDVGPNGDNVVLPNQVSDTFSVFPGYDTDAPYANWRICISPGGNPTRSAEYVSSDGVRWRFLRRTGQHGDCTTMFHNPFLGKWIWSLRASWRHRSRIYHSHVDFYDGADWHFPLGHGHAQTNTVDCALWLACDNRDLPRTMGDGKTYTNSQLYNVDAVPYESIMVSLFKILCGYENDIAARAGMPKTTSIHFAYSRDGVGVGQRRVGLRLRGQHLQLFRDQGRASVVLLRGRARRRHAERSAAVRVRERHALELLRGRGDASARRVRGDGGGRSWRARDAPRVVLWSAPLRERRRAVRRGGGGGAGREGRAVSRVFGCRLQSHCDGGFHEARAHVDGRRPLAVRGQARALPLQDEGGHALLVLGVEEADWRVGRLRGPDYKGLKDE